MKPNIVSALVASLTVCLLTALPCPAGDKPDRLPSATVFREQTVNMDFVLIKGSCFRMGDTAGDGQKDERPVHDVCIGDFHLGQYEVSVGQFRRFADESGYRTDAEKGGGCHVWNGTGWDRQAATSWRSPRFEQSDLYPVTCVSWNDAQAFIHWLSGKDGKRYALPTEAQWEYAARGGGLNRKYAWGDSKPSGNLADLALKRIKPKAEILDGYDDGYAFTAPVGSYYPNDLGLFNMTGNVWEWCQDWYGEKYYAASPVSNPKGPETGSFRILRGGSWHNTPWYARTTYRTASTPDTRGTTQGFRLAFPAEGK